MIKSVDGIRTKIIEILIIKILKQFKRSNNSKLQYQYLCLRKLDKVKEYLRYYPEHGKEFQIFRTQIHQFTKNLHINYINCYINKEKPLKDFPIQFRSHMFNLHQHYLQIIEIKGYINKSIVIEYINNLESAKLMYSLNYHMRKVVDKDKLMEMTS